MDDRKSGVVFEIGGQYRGHKIEYNLYMDRFFTTVDDEELYGKEGTLKNLMGEIDTLEKHQFVPVPVFVYSGRGNYVQATVTSVTNDKQCVWVKYAPKDLASSSRRAKVDVCKQVFIDNEENRKLITELEKKKEFIKALEEELSGLCDGLVPFKP